MRHAKRLLILSAASLAAYIAAATTVPLGAAVVKVQTWLLDSALLARSWAPVVMVPVNVVLLASAAVGV